MGEGFTEEICELLNNYCSDEGRRVREHMRQHAEVIRTNFSEPAFQSNREFVINTFMLHNMFSEDNANIYLSHTNHDYMKNKSPQQTNERELKNRIGKYIL